MSLSPGQPSIIPGGAEMIVQFRDAEPDTLDRLKAKLLELVKEADEGPCDVTIEVMGESKPAHMSTAVQSTLIEAAKTHTPEKWLVHAIRRRSRRPGDCAIDTLGDDVRTINWRH